MSKFVSTSVLWTKVWNTKPDANETVAKGIIRSMITADVNAGKLEYSSDEIQEMLVFAYGRAGSKTPEKKAKLVWSNFARPGKEGWFVEVA